jgi:hypothetical protein
MSTPPSADGWLGHRQPTKQSSTVDLLVLEVADRLRPFVCHRSPLQTHIVLDLPLPSVSSSRPTEPSSLPCHSHIHCTSCLPLPAIDHRHIARISPPPPSNSLSNHTHVTSPEIQSLRFQAAAAHVMCSPTALTVTDQQHIVTLQTTTITTLTAPEACAVELLQPCQV